MRESTKDVASVACALVGMVLIVGASVSDSLRVLAVALIPMFAATWLRIHSHREIQSRPRKEQFADARELTHAGH